MHLLKKIYRMLKPKNVTYAQISYQNPSEMMLGSTVVVTGGATGIGYAIAEKCVREGAKVIVAGRREDRLKQACERLGANAHYVVCDVCNVQQLDDFVNSCTESFGIVPDVLVNNAGVYVARSWAYITEADWNRQFDTDAKGSYFTALKFLKLWQEKNIEGNMIFVVSDRAYQGDITPYGMTKAAVDNFVKGLAKEAIQYGISVNGVAPGMTASEINHIDPKGDIRAEFTRGKRVILAEEIAEVVGFLISNTSKCIVGDVILCDEGESIK